MTVPLVVVLALVFGAVTGGGSDSAAPSSSAPASSSAPVYAPLTVAAPPSDAAADAPCTALLAKLPQTLDTSRGALAARPAFSESPYVAAWGEPAIVLRCGVARPAQLTPGSSDLLLGVNGVFFLPVKKDGSTVFTAVDRAAYVEVTVPSAYDQPPLGPIASAVAEAMKPVCVVDPNEADLSKLCTRRK